MAMAVATLSSVMRKTHKLLGMLDSSALLSSESSTVEEVLTNLKSMLPRIQSAALAAEEIGDAVRPWICKVKTVAYDAEDVLDDCEHELLLLLQHQGMGQPEDSVSMSTSASSLHKISEIQMRFEEIVTEQEALNLRERDVRMMPPYRTTPALSPPDSIEPTFYGREDDMQRIVELLLSPLQQCQGDQPPVVSVTGEAGVGKTTLCWLVFTDPRIREHFEVRIWASVPQQCYAMDSISGYSSSREISYLPYLLQWELVNKGFLLVLDELDLQGKDVQFWNGVYDHLRVGGRGSKVLLTTRDEEHLAKLMAAMPTKYRVRHLSEESSWSLFKVYAFHGRDPEALLSLAVTGREIARKCRGSPLVVKMMGASLHSEDASEERWKNILRGRSWEGYPFTRDQLVRLWMAQDFVAPVEGKRMEDAADGFVDELLWRSFLDNPPVGEQIIVMPGLIHDLAESLLPDGYSREDDGRQICSISIDARHSSLLPCDDACSKEIYLPSRSEPVYLRSFLLVKRWGHAGDGFYLPEEGLFRLQIPDGFFLPLGHLKALDLSYSNLEELPESIGLLKHLGYLSLSYTSITKLPESVVNLHGLQTLELRSCGRLYMLPGGIKKLTNLRHLDWFNLRTSWAPLPDIGELTNLQTLPSFVVGRRRGHSDSTSTITQLKQLVDLRGELCIVGLSGILFSEDADEAKLSNKERLEKLTLEWYGMYSYHMTMHCNIDEEKKVREIDSDEGASSEDREEGGEMTEEERRLYNMRRLTLEEIEKRGNMGCHHRQHPRKPNRWYREEVLESLRPHPNLRHLVIDAYDGVRLPNWMGDPSFSSLVSLTLRGCYQCRSLPFGLGQLPYLKRLSIRFLGLNKQTQGRSPEPIVMKGFLSLEQLEVDQMPHWEEWCVIEDGNFPKMLQSLSISYCPRLKRLPQCLPALTKLQITRREQLTGFPAAPSLLTLDIAFHGNPDERVESWFSWLEQLTTLQSLNISGIRDLSSTPLQKHPALKRLVISHCQWDKRPHFLLGLHNLPALRRLEISVCKELCFLPDERLPLTLKVLHITWCPLLRDWCLQQRSKLAHISQITLDESDYDQVQGSEATSQPQVPREEEEQM